MTPNLTAANLTTDYEFLISLWFQWLDQPQWQPLDRWLKSQKKMSRDPLQAGIAMHAAMRYLHLACALEEAYKNPQEKLDIQSWDQQWSLQDIKKVPSQALWYWIALRAAEGQQTTLAAPKKLRDAHQRYRFFLQWRALGEVNQNNVHYWLWQGLRPSWKALLDERAIQSGWSNESYQDFMAQQTVQPPLWLRLQHDVTASSIVAGLRHSGIHAIETDDGVSLHGGKNIITSQAYRDGAIEIQDLASQQIAAAIAVKPGQKVWDACAGAGGKTLAIAARMDNKGVVVATDLQAFKLEEIKRRAKRAAFFNIRTFPWNGEAPLRLPAEVARQAGFDWVLVDAPCSSSGTWRRNPDARWHFNPETMLPLLNLQQQLLHQASAGVRKSGALVYATCSWLVSENEHQVQQFLASNPSFSLEYMTLAGAPEKDADTMFVAVMRKM